MRREQWKNLNNDVGNRAKILGNCKDKRILWNIAVRNVQMHIQNHSKFT